MSERICHTCKIKQDYMPTCGFCRALFYCSRECQKKDWEKHKLICNPEYKNEARKDKKIAFMLHDMPKFKVLMMDVLYFYYNKNKTIVCRYITDQEYVIESMSFTSDPPP